jgi:hypothetical protein
MMVPLVAEPWCPKTPGKIPVVVPLALGYCCSAVNFSAATGEPIQSPPLSFAWDRRETRESLKGKLAEARPDQWIELASWILREARLSEVWEFLRPEEIKEHWEALEPRLGRRRALWSYLLETWHELGKL